MTIPTILKGDKKSQVYSDWSSWLSEVGAIYCESLDRYDYRAFHDHEQAAVSLMVGAAHRAGLLAFAECSVAKGERKGRGDMWLAAGETDYWFEFKRSAFDPNASKWGLNHALEVAMSDAKKLDYVKGEVGVAGVIAATSTLRAGYRSVYLDFVDEVDFAFRVGPDGSRGSYLYFKLLESK